MKQPFTCFLCARAGRKTLAPRARHKSVICADCEDSIEASGRFWCNPGRHIVEASDWRPSRKCNPCKTATNRKRLADPDLRAQRRERVKAWKAANPERVKVHSRRFYATHPGYKQDRKLDYQRKRRARPDVRAKLIAYNREYRKRYPHTPRPPLPTCKDAVLEALSEPLTARELAMVVAYSPRTIETVLRQLKQAEAIVQLPQRRYQRMEAYCATL